MAEAPSSNRYAVVTGANKGIGLEICRQLASRGVTVVLTARDEKRGLEAVQKLKASSGFSDDLVVFHQLDVADPTAIASLASFIKAQFGRLDILVNNAGVSGVTVDADSLKASLAAGAGTWDAFSQAMTQPYETAEECLKTNYYGIKHIIEAHIPLLKLSKSPRIVNVSSSMGKLEHVKNEWAKGVLSNVESLTEETIEDVLNEFMKDFKDGSFEAKGWPTHMPAYILSKAALNGYTRTVARKHPDLCINSVCPGFVKTDINFNTGTLTVEDGAEGPVKLALAPDGGSSGLFFSRTEESSF